MKLKVRVSLDRENERIFDVAVGIGDKTFKWLSLVASQRYALASPAGGLRRREEYRGATERAQHHAREIILPDGEVPHPSAIISDFLHDGEEVVIILIDVMKIDPKTSSGKRSNWSTVAFTTQGNLSGSQVVDEDDDGWYEEDSIDEGESVDVEIEEMALNQKIQSSAKFLNICYKSQMLNRKKLAHELETDWIKFVKSSMPNLSEMQSDALKDVFEKYWAILQAVYIHFSTMTPPGSMPLDNFLQFLSECSIFPHRDIPSVGARIYKKICKALNVENTFNFGCILPALILCAQSRHNDTFEKNSSVQTSHDALEEIFIKNIVPLAEKMEMPMYLKEIFCSDKSLHAIRRFHDPLFLVFTKYANKAKDMSVSIPIQQMSECLFESGLLPEGSLSVTEELFQQVKSGAIFGRAIGQPGDDIIPDDEFTFPEFIEVCALAGFKKWKSIDSTTPPPKFFVSPGSDGDEEEEEEFTIIHGFVHGLMGAESSLTYVPKVEETNTRGNRGNSRK
jgi:hypothetical protein